MKTTRDLLKAKDSDIYCVASDQSALDAAKLMTDKGIGGLLVIDDGKLVGIVTERDYLRKTHADGRSTAEIKISEIMVSKVQCAAPNDSVTDCMEIMTNGRFRHLPVKDGEELLGVLSIGDLVKATIKEQSQLIQQLEQFIKS